MLLKGIEKPDTTQFDEQTEIVSIPTSISRPTQLRHETMVQI